MLLGPYGALSPQDRTAGSLWGDYFDFDPVGKRTAPSFRRQHDSILSKAHNPPSYRGSVILWCRAWFSLLCKPDDQIAFLYGEPFRPSLGDDDFFPGYYIPN